ncbi:MAG: FAD-binding protein, partial [Candidatus Omnitrophica bacterium]|nr:FAD-binding protein [Candidatus Omnitrophota bacterium]
MAKNSGIPVRVIGRGTNLLVDDRGVRGLVLRLNSKNFKKISAERNYLNAGSGATLSKLIETASLKGLSGIEFLAGIPGTVGGAVSMNAGAWGKSIGNLVEEVEVMDYSGSIKKLTKNELKFKHRGCNLGKFIILNVR